MRTILTLACLLSVNVLGVAADKAKTPLVDTIQRIKQAVVPIVCAGENKEGHLFIISVEGTGFFLSDDGDVVSAGHVASSLFTAGRLPACPVPAIYVPKNGWGKSATLRVISIRRCWWNDDDIGLCSLRENPFTSEFIPVKPLIGSLDSQVQPDGTAVAFTGFPLSFTEPITSQGTIGMYRGTADLGPTEMIVDKSAWPGASGSPVYASDGAIVGLLIQRGFNDASGIAFARTSVYISAFLAKNKAERQRETEQQQKEPATQH